MQKDKIDIAIGSSVASRSWKNEKWSWEQISEKLLTENKTNETYTQFITASKTDQLRIKDVGGYVGGYLRGGRRKPENVLHRQLLTLDIDQAHLNFWDEFTLQYHQAAILHATHKHSPTSPRYRLVMPLSRECSPDEYAALSRQVAGVIGIDLFDNTTFQSERLMFWPSSAKDVEYYAVEQSGPWLDVDQVLNSYVDWTDSSAWPTAEATLNSVHEKQKKQEDPEEKSGLVGAFCRSFSISQAIEKFLFEEYKPAGKERYTYTKGSAAAGLVVYEDKYAYSHHGTDPVGGHLCNAFDLVRLHKYGHLDANLSEGKNTKSMAAMNAFCLEVEEVKKTIAVEKLSEASYDFGEDAEQIESVDLDWVQDLELDKKGGYYLSTASNISLVLANDPKLKNLFGENLFDNKKYILKSPPWRKIDKKEPVKNVDYAGLRNYIESVYGIANVGKIDDALNLEYQKYSFHPVRDYLNSLKWDGVKRIETLLIDYFGAVDNVYTRAVTRKTLAAAVTRIFRPGVKFDHVLTLVGQKQGTGKSTFISRLGGPFFSDSFHTISGKESFEQLQGAWIIEMAELSGIRKNEVENIKHFISKQEDTFRPAYGRITETYKRQCIFVATTNERDFLRDASGNRRFWPVDVQEKNIKKDVFGDEFKKSIDQIWAEAVELYKTGETLYLSGEAESLALVSQSKHSQVDDRFGLIEQYVNTLLPEEWDSMNLTERRNFLEKDPLTAEGSQTREFVCVAEVWCECFNRDKKDLQRFQGKEVADMIKLLDGWEYSSHDKFFPLYGRQRYFKRINN